MKVTINKVHFIIFSLNLQFWKESFSYIQLRGLIPDNSVLHDPLFYPFYRTNYLMLVILLLDFFCLLNHYNIRRS